MALTLKETLEMAGDGDQVHYLTPNAQKFTKNKITAFLAGNNDDDLSDDDKESLGKLALVRIKQGKSIFPWGTMENIDPQAEGSPSGSFW